MRENVKNPYYKGEQAQPGTQESVQPSAVTNTESASGGMPADVQSGAATGEGNANAGSPVSMQPNTSFPNPGIPTNAAFAGAGANAAAYPAPGVYYTSAKAHAARTPYDYSVKDAVLAGLSFLIGLLFFELTTSGIASEYIPGVSVTIFYVIAAVVSGAYMNSVGHKQTAGSIAVLAIFLAAASAFTLYDISDTSLRRPLILFIFVMALMWVMTTCHRSIAKRLSGYVLMDLIHQTLVVPFVNFPTSFMALIHSSKGKKGNRAFLYTFIGIIVAIPVIIGVVALLTSADAGFENIINKITDAINFDNIGEHILELILGIPIACYVCGSVFGNANGRYTDSITKEGTDKSLAGLRKLPIPALNAPLTVLTAIYALFFIAMGTYIFSAFAGSVSGDFTYAEYARRGFFELCGVAAINLSAIIFVYLFARRGASEYPKSVRGLTAAISAMTLLLIATAMSKMFLYVDMFGLTRLRVYTIWFMFLLAAVFIVIIIWHMKPFNAGKPIAIVFAALCLILFLGNTDGIIAKYNVDNYLSGNLKEVDTSMLTELSDAAIPSMIELAQRAENPDVKSELSHALAWHKYNYAHSRDYESEQYTDMYRDPRSWNVQSAMYRPMMEAKIDRNIEYDILHPPYTFADGERYYDFENDNESSYRYDPDAYADR